jgi:hypothetical protein
MRDERDKKTSNLLATGSAARQTRFADQQRAMGRKARKIWATDEEVKALRQQLEQMRAAQAGDNGPDRA